MYGPTIGDKIRLADTEIIIEVEHDHTIYGEEVKFGGGNQFVMVWLNLHQLAPKLCRIW